MRRILIIYYDIWQVDAYKERWIHKVKLVYKVSCQNFYNFSEKKERKKWGDDWLQTSRSFWFLVLQSVMHSSTLRMELSHMEIVFAQNRNYFGIWRMIIGGIWKELVTYKALQGHIPMALWWHFHDIFMAESYYEMTF